MRHAVRILAAALVLPSAASAFHPHKHGGGQVVMPVGTPVTTVQTQSWTVASPVVATQAFTNVATVPAVNVRTVAVSPITTTQFVVGTAVPTQTFELRFVGGGGNGGGVKDTPPTELTPEWKELKAAMAENRAALNRLAATVEASAAKASPATTLNPALPSGGGHLAEEKRIEELFRSGKVEEAKSEFIKFLIDFRKHEASVERLKVLLNIQ